MTISRVLATFSFIILVQIARSERKPNELADQLTEPSRYDKRSRPWGFPSPRDPVRITANLYIYVIGGLDTQTMEFTSQLLIRYSWYDPRLAYSSLAPEVTSLSGESWLAERIWIPTVFIVNEKHSSRITLPAENVHVTLSPDGLVRYQYRMNLGMYCAMDVQKFPFDYQECTLHLESWSLPSSELVLQWDGDDKGPVYVNTEFPLLEYRLTQTKASFALHQRHDGDFSQLRVQLTLAREAGHYILDFYVPAMFLVTLSWVSFWLDPNAAPGRVAIGTSTLLTFITLTRNVGTSIPKVSYIKAVDVYSMMCTAFIFCSLLEFAFVNSVWRRRRNIEVKKLDTRHVLKSTLTPSLSRRNSNLHPQKSYSAIDIRHADNHFFGDHSSQNELTVTSLSAIGSRLTSSASLNNLNISRPYDYSTSINKSDRCLSLTIPVPDVTSGLHHVTLTPSMEDSAPNVTEKKSMSPQEIAKWLDRRSRIVFPVTFLLANALYWSFIWL